MQRSRRELPRACHLSDGLKSVDVLLRASKPHELAPIEQLRVPGSASFIAWRLNSARRACRTAGRGGATPAGSAASLDRCGRSAIGFVGPR
jgi:hypothetical protein